MKDIEGDGLFEYKGEEIHMFVPNRIRKVVITQSNVTYQFSIPERITIVAADSDSI